MSALKALFSCKYEYNAYMFVQRNSVKFKYGLYSKIVSVDMMQEQKEQKKRAYSVASKASHLVILLYHNTVL